MWILTLFDLPMLTAAQRRTYGRFRKFLLKLGFEALQKSVYLRWASSSEAAETFRHEILRRVPQSGTVTVLPFTERNGPCRWQVWPLTASFVQRGQNRMNFLFSDPK